MNTMAHRARRSSADTVARQAEREIFGEEPTSIYHDSAKDSRRLHLMRCLAWYSRFMETDDFKEETLEWCKDKRILHIEKMWDKVCLTYPALLRMTYRGFVLTHQEQQKVERYFQELSDRYGVISPSFTSSNHNFAPKMIISSTVSVNVTDKADIILSELIELEEKIGKKNLVIASSWNIKNTIIEHKISRGGLNTIITFANKRVSEYSGVLLGTSVDLVEGYSTFSKTTLRNLNQFWNRVLWSISSIQESYKQNRKPRKSATKTATIISSKSSTVPISFVFKATDAEFSVTSIKPENIIGAKWVVIFNTKYRIARTNSQIL